MAHRRCAPKLPERSPNFKVFPVRLFVDAGERIPLPARLLLDQKEREGESL
jgi:hypothetical protein